MQVERRALYNSLRMNWLQDSSLAVKPWQVEDYRLYRIENLFDRLNQRGIQLDKSTFLGLAEVANSPEQLTDDLLADQSLEAEAHDQIYLLLFELWRRLLPERLCLSIFCDELDYQIFSYDRGDVKSEAIPNVLAQLEVVLDENADEGVDPVHVFETVCSGCANDIESFLYDFIAEQIDTHNESYASELLEEYCEYVKEIRWFNFLKARLLSSTDTEGSNLLIRKIVQDAAKQPDLEFNFEVLSSMASGGESDVFVKLVKQTIPLLQYEEDFKDLLILCGDFCHLLDKESDEQAIMQIVQKRSRLNPEGLLRQSDPQISELLKIIKEKN